MSKSKIYNQGDVVDYDDDHDGGGSDDNHGDGGDDDNDVDDDDADDYDNKAAETDLCGGRQIIIRRGPFSSTFSMSVMMMMMMMQGLFSPFNITQQLLKTKHISNFKK